MKKQFVLVMMLSGLMLFLSYDDAVAMMLPEQGTKVAYIGDSGWKADFRSVLRLIKAERADLVVHLGDFDYEYNPKGFEGVIDAELGETFPYLVVPGNHDMKAWPHDCTQTNNSGCYAKIFADRYAASGIRLTKEDLTSQTYTLNFQGVQMVVVGAKVNKELQAYENYLATQLDQSNYAWKVCNWHKNQQTMQVGGKTDEMGWGVYETCMDAGAIIATAHEHSYQRTKTLSQFQGSGGVKVHSQYSDPTQLMVMPEATFVFVSGLGGNGIRNQERCQPFTYPYGCNGEWASIYTSNQQAKYGALFVTFNPEGDPYQALGYFKNIDGAVVDNFRVTVASNTTPPPIHTPTEAPQPPSPDTNGDEDVDVFDVAMFMKRFFLSRCGVGMDLDEDCDVDILDIKEVIRALSGWLG